MEDYREEVETLSGLLMAALNPLRIMLAGALAYEESGEDLEEDAEIFLLVILREETAPEAMQQAQAWWREYRKIFSLQLLMGTSAQIVQRREQKTKWLEMVLEKGEVLFEAADYEAALIDPEEY